MLQDRIEHSRKSHRSMLQVVLNFTFNQKFAGTSVKEVLTTVKKLHEPAGDAFVYSSGESSPTYHEALRLLSSQSDRAGALSRCIKLECSLYQLYLHQLLHDKLCGHQK